MLAVMSVSSRVAGSCSPLLWPSESHSYGLWHHTQAPAKLMTQDKVIKVGDCHGKNSICFFFIFGKNSLTFAKVIILSHSNNFILIIILHKHTKVTKSQSGLIKVTQMYFLFQAIYLILYANFHLDFI
jgi:hypothetical protein